jgi:hypothetical protein
MQYYNFRLFGVLIGYLEKIEIERWRYEKRARILVIKSKIIFQDYIPRFFVSKFSLIVSLIVSL